MVGIAEAETAIGVLGFSSVGEEWIISTLPQDAKSVARIITGNVFIKFFFMVLAAQRLALPAGGRDGTTPFCRNPLQATKPA